MNSYVTFARDAGAFYMPVHPNQPLVGLKTKSPRGKRRVAKYYINFPLLAENAGRLEKIAEAMLALSGSADVYCGIPTGGKQIANLIALRTGHENAFLEKVLFRDSYELQISKEDEVLYGNKRVIIVEDVVSTGATLEEAISLITGTGACVVGCISFWDRSIRGIQKIGIFPHSSLVKFPIQTWEEDDPEVAKDVADDNVVWDPKKHWSVLQMAMEGKLAPNFKLAHYILAENYRQNFFA